MDLQKRSRQKNTNPNSRSFLQTRSHVDHTSPESCERQIGFFRFWGNKFFKKFQQIDSIKHRPSCALIGQEQGFTLVYVCLFLGMSVAIAFALMPVAWFIIEKQKIQLLCEKNVLAAQENLVKGENQLLAMNAPIQALVLQKRALETAIAAAPAPPLQAALTARLLAVVAQMRTLRLRQQLTIKVSESRAQKSLVIFQMRVRKEIRNIQRALKSPPLLVFFNLTPVKMKLVPIFLDPLIPIYKPPPGLPFLQTLSFELRIKGRQFFPSWLSLLKSKNHFFWREFCSSHPKQGGFQWESYLGTGKYF
jgi:hypothetical protein